MALVCYLCYRTAHLFACIHTYILLALRFVKVLLKFDYRQHCAQRKPPICNLLRGRFWGYSPRDTLHWRCNDKGVGPQKLKFLLSFDQNVECKRPTGAYPLRDFHKICRICTPFQDALAVKIWLDLLEGLWSYGVFSWGGLVTPILSAPLAAKLCITPPKSFRGAKTCSRSSITVPSLVGIGFHPPPGWPKTLSFLSVCLLVRHAFERQRLCARFRHEGVGFQKRFWYRWIGEGL